MFVATEAFRTRLPIPGDEAGQFYMAVMLSTESPWFLVTHRGHAEARPRMLQTVAVAWEVTLVAIVQTLGSECVAGVTRMAPAREGTRCWTSTELTELWIPSEEEATDCGPLLFRAAREACVRDSFGIPVESHRRGRELLLRVTSSTQFD
jgi:hypothetical protein